MTGCVAFSHYLDIPHLDSRASRERLAEGLRDLRRRLEQCFETSVSDPGLAAAVKLYNRTRELLARVSRLRSEDPPRARGSEVLAMAVAAASAKRRISPR